MVPDADELVLFEGSQSIGDAFIFEPTTEEAKLGWLFAAAEIGQKDTLGREILETIIQAVQREYYRDGSRTVSASFEAALHQANMILHDLAEKRVRNWMNTFHVSIGVLARTINRNVSAVSDAGDDGMALYISTAGEGIVMLARSRQVSVISTGLSHSPITDPLRSFSQVASGQIYERDILYLATANFDQIFRKGDLARFVADQTAEGIATRLMQLYWDQKIQLPVAALVIAMTEQPATRLNQNEKGPAAGTSRQPLALAAGLMPRKPILIQRSWFINMFILTGRLLWQAGLAAWPYVKSSSVKGGRVLYQASRSASQSVHFITANKLKGFSKLPAGQIKPLSISSPSLFSLRSLVTSMQRLFKKLMRSAKTMPLSSKVFGILALILASSLGISLVMLQSKRATDAQIQQASERLHEASTKKEAAETALIYDNRDQARQLLTEAQQLAEIVAIAGFYHEQTEQLKKEITATVDRLDKVARLSTAAAHDIGDFAPVLTGNSRPTRLFFIDEALYSFDPASNAILRMQQDGQVAKVSQTTQGIGFLVNGIAHLADKTILFLTNEPGLAVYDTKTGLLQKQEIEWPSDQPQILSLATFGNRVYLYDQTSKNIYGYSKTLRGYSGGSAWLTANNFPRDTIKEIGVDGYVYTLHSDGSLNKLLKGAPVAFNMERLSPPFSSAARILINENLRHLYIFDPANNRLVIYDTVGNLSRQVFLDQESQPVDVALNQEETTLYLLSGTKVKAVSLTEIENRN